MFIVNDPGVAQTICAFYDHPENVGWRDELERLGLLDRVQEYAAAVKKLQLGDFIKNERWTGITCNMDKYLPTIITNARDINDRVPLSKSGDVLRKVSVQATQPITHVELRSGNVCWFSGEPPGLTEFTIDIKPGMPIRRLYYHELSLVSTPAPEKVLCAYTFLPNHIARQLHNAKGALVVPSLGKDYYLEEGTMSTI